MAALFVARLFFTLQSRSGPGAALAPDASGACDDASFVRLERTRPHGYTEVTVCGTVTSVSREETTRSGRHKYFYVRVDQAIAPVEIVTNLDETGEFAVKPGDTATVRGRYYDDDPSSQGIDWTHRTGANASWPYPGYVQINGGALVR